MESDVTAKGFTKNTGTYSKPSGGIPKTDLALAVQTSLEKADSAIQPEHIIKVKQDGTGDFTNLRVAVESITDASLDNPYIIEVYQGTYNVHEYYTSAEIQTGTCKGINLTDGMTLRGVGDRNQIILNGVLSEDDYTLAQRNYFSVLNVGGACTIENITVTAKSIRYCIHDDWSRADNTVCIKNVKMSADYRMTSGHNYISYGQGLNNGSVTIFEDVDFGGRYI